MNVDPNVAADAVVKVLKALTWKRIAYLAVLLMLSVVALAVWMNREYLAGIGQPAKLSLDTTPIELTYDVQHIAAAVLKNESIINSVGVVSVNAPANTRRLIFFKSNDPQISEQYELTLARVVTKDVPLIGNNVKDNQTLIRLLNGELVCRPWSESVSSKYLVNVNVKFVCSVGIPPDYGRFRGIVMVYLSVVPNEIEEHQVRIMLRELSMRLDNPKRKS